MVTIPFSGLLFDLDGTLVSSIPAVTRSWTMWANNNGLDPKYVLSRIHGRPAIESIRELLSGASETDIQHAMVWLEHSESTDTHGVTPIEGAIDLLTSLDVLNVPWAIVTSGTIPVANARIKAAGLPMPKHLITLECVTRGKPDPEPYLVGAKALGLDITDCLCFEDASAGVISAKTANAKKVLAVLSHSTKEKLSQADHWVENYLGFEVKKSQFTGFELKLPRSSVTKLI